jgi:hypothetical protein
MSEQPMPKQIAEVILSVMKEVGYVQKKGTNTFHGYKYASIEDVLEKVQPELAKAGLVITQNELDHAIVADNHLMEARYAFHLSSRDGATWGPLIHTGLASVRNQKGGYDDKALNKCHTTARKYFILALFQIPTGLAADPDDDEDRPAALVTYPEARGNAQTMVGRKNEAKGISDAREWVNTAIARLGKLTTTAMLDAFVDKNNATMEKIREIVPEEYAALAKRIDEAAARLNVLAAG